MWSNLVCQGKSFLTWVRDQSAPSGRRSTRRGWGRISGEIFFLSRKTWWEAHQAWISSLYPINNSDSQSPAKCLSLPQALWPLSSMSRDWFPLGFLTSYQPSLFTWTSWTWEIYLLLHLPSPSLPLSPLPQHWPSLAWLLFFQTSEMLLLLQCMRKVTTHIEKQPVLTLFPWRQICRGRGQWIGSFSLKLERIDLICCMTFRRESGMILPDVKWQSVVL